MFSARVFFSSPKHQDHLNLLDYSLVIVSWLDVATSASTYRERVTLILLVFFLVMFVDDQPQKWKMPTPVSCQVQLASTIRVFRFVRIVRLAEGSKSGLLIIARGLYNAVEHVLQLSVITAVFVFVIPGDFSEMFWQKGNVGLTTKIDGMLGGVDVGET